MKDFNSGFLVGGVSSSVSGNIILSLMHLTSCYSFLAVASTLIITNLPFLHCENSTWSPHVAPP